MTRKDYIIIAKALKEIRNSYVHGDSVGLMDCRQRLIALDDVTINLACSMRADNPAFDLELFKTASGM